MKIEIIRADTLMELEKSTNEWLELNEHKCHSIVVHPAQQRFRGGAFESQFYLTIVFKEIIC